MKKRIKFLSFLPILLLSMLFGFSVFNLNRFQVYQKGDFESFSSAYQELLKDNPYDDYKEVSFNLNQDVYKMNDTYMVDSDTFADLTGSNVSINASSEVVVSASAKTVTMNAHDNTLIINNNNVEVLPEGLTILNDSATFPIENVAKALGFALRIEQDNLYLSNTQTNRLVIKSDKSLNKQGAVKYAEGYNGLHIYQYATEEDALNAYNYYKNLDDVKFVVQDYVGSINSEEDSSMEYGGLNSEYYSWGAQYMGVSEYSSYLNTEIGTNNLKEVVVAVLDTGICSYHSWFEDRIKDGGKDFTSEESETGYDYEDYHGHGSHVSGIITDLTLPNVKILPLKVGDSQGRIPFTGAILAIEYVTSLKAKGMNICAMNMSFGFNAEKNTDAYNIFKDAIDNAYSAGVLSVVAAGNDSGDSATKVPANIESCITVGAIGVTNGVFFKSAYSNMGEEVDICAPGDWVLSAVNGGNLAYMSGTSMAAPHIAGIVALLSSDSVFNYSVSRLEYILKTETIDLGESGYDTYFGYGLPYIAGVYLEEIENVKFSSESATITEPFELTLTHSNPNAKIYYTNDKSVPSSTNGTLYETPILINSSQEIKAVAYIFENGKAVAKSEVVEHVYLLNGNDSENAYTVNSLGVLVKYNGVLTDVIVPNEYNGIKITAIGERAFEALTIETVTLQKNVTSIADYAFYNCTSLKNVDAQGVTSIGNYAFCGCSKLKGVNDSNFLALKTIGDYAFQNCISLTDISLSNVTYIGQYSFNACMQLTNVVMDNITEINDDSFKACSELASITMPNVKVVGNYAFESCDLISVDLPVAVSLGMYAFSNNYNLKELNIPEVERLGSYCFAPASLSDTTSSKIETLYAPKLEVIGFRAFYGSTKLAKIDLPKAKTILNYAFHLCRSLKEINLPNVEFIGLCVFDDIAGLEEISLPSVKFIGSNAFYNCANLKTIELSRCVTTISYDAFLDINEDCQFVVYDTTIAKDFVIEKGFNHKIISDVGAFDYKVENNEISIIRYYNNVTEEVIIPLTIDGLKVTKILSNAFANLPNLLSVKSDYITEVCDNAFYGCENLVKVFIPNVKSIGNSAFENCKSLTEIDISRVENVNEKAFFKCDSLRVVVIENNGVLIQDKSFGYYSEDNVLTEFVMVGHFDSAVETYAKENGLVYRPLFKNISLDDITYVMVSNTIIIQKINPLLSGNVIIPDTIEDCPVVEIADEAFQNCTMITGVILPETVTELGEVAFTYCSSLKYINLNNITSMGMLVFFEGESLQIVEMPNLKVVPMFAFANGLSLEYVNIENATKISNDAFFASNLREIKCGKVKTIGECAFAFNNHLKEMYVPELISLSNEVFRENFSLNYIFVPKLTTIGNYTFQETKSLKKIYLPSIESIGENAFLDSALETIIIGRNFTTYTSTSINNSATIYGYAGSTAETYALLYGNPFVAIDELAITTNLPATKEFYQYSDATLEITATGFEQTYQWFMTDSDVANGVAIDGATSSTLNIDTKTLGNKKYYVVVTDWDGSTITSELCSVLVVDDGLEKFDITASVIGDGELSETGTIIVSEGANKTINFVANEGYEIESVKIDGVLLTGDDLQNAIINGYTFNNISGNHSIETTFAVKQYTVTVIQAENGTISQADEYYEYGANASFTITPNEGYKVKYLLIDNEIWTNSLNEYSFVNISENHTISALFVSLTMASYTVKHWQQSLTTSGATLIDDKYYNLVYTDTSLIGKIGQNTNAVANTYEGFTVRLIEQKTILDDGSTVVNILYDRVIYTLTIVKGEGIESVSSSKNYLFGQSVSITATLLEGYNFKGWESSNTDLLAGSLSTNYTFNMPAGSVTLTAVGAIKQFNVSIFSNNGGVVTPPTSQVVCYGSNLVLEIIPNYGYNLDQVLVDGIDVTSKLVGNLYTISSIKEDHNVSVLFSLKTYIISASESSNGKILPAGNSTVSHGENKTYAFIPNEGYKIDKVYVDDISVGNVNSYTFENITSGHTIYVLFTKIAYTITATAGENGTISPTGETSVYYGDGLTYTFTPSAGYKVKDVKVNNSSVGAVSTYSFINVSEHQTISVEFEKIILTINISCGNNGTVSPQTMQTVEYGASFELVITPSSGYKVTKLLLDDVDKTNYIVGNKYTISNIVTNHSLSVEFGLLAYTITATSSDNGTISPSGNVSVNYGYDKTFVFTPEAGCKIEDVFVDGESVGKVNSYTFESVSEDHTINVVFTRSSFTITALAIGEGTISPVGVSNVYYGDSLTYTFTPNEGYRVKNVKINDIAFGAINTYTFINVTSSHTITVEFEVETFKISLSVSGEGSVNCDKSLENIIFGENRVLTFAPEEGWELFKVYVNGSNVDVNDNTLTISNIKEDTSINVIFNGIPKGAENDKGLDKTTIIIIVATAGIASLLTAGIITTNIKAGKKKKEDFNSKCDDARK